MTAAATTARAASATTRLRGMGRMFMPGRMRPPGRPRIARELDPRAQPELGVDVAQVGLDGLRAEHQLLRHLAVGPAAGHEHCDLTFPRGERAEGAIAVACRAHDAVAEPAQLPHR